LPEGARRAEIRFELGERDGEVILRAPVTRFTVTSVVCAERITETRSSRSVRKRSAITASGCAAARRSITGRTRSFFGPTRRRASRT